MEVSRKTIISNVNATTSEVGKVPLNKIPWRDYLKQKFPSVPLTTLNDEGRPDEASAARLNDFSNSAVSEMCGKCIDQQVKTHGKRVIKCSGLASSDEMLPDGIRHLFSKEEVEQFEEIANPYFWADKYIDPHTPEDKRMFSKRWYQEQMVRCTATRKVYRCGRRTGKALALTTLIPTPAGWTTMGELEIGDRVIGSDGDPCNVTFVTEIQYGRECYEVEFNDGTVIVADADHQWTVETRAIRKANARNVSKKLGAITLTTKDMLEDVRVGSKSESNYSIRNTLPVNYDGLTIEDASLHPYLLGYWIGSPYLNDAIVLLDPSTVDSYDSRMPDYEWDVLIDERVSYRAYPIQAELEGLGVYETKQIPESYLYGSKELRLELLKGIMDAAGCTIKTGTVEYSSMDKKLAEDVSELIRSMGLRAFPKKTSTYVSKDGLENFKYRVLINPYFNIFRNKEKAQVIGDRTHLQKNRYIVEIRRTESAPVRCITVDSEDSLYLASESFIPTHNTYSFSLNILHRVMTNENYKVLIATPYEVQAEELINQIRELIYRLDPEWGSYQDLVIKDVKSPNYVMQFSNRSRIRAFTTGSSGAGSVRGQSAHLIVLDEVDYMSESDFNSILAILADHPDTELWVASTPNSKKALYRLEQLSAYKKFHFPTFVLPHYNDQLDQDFRDGLTDVGYVQEIMAEFGASELGVFQSYYVDKCIHPEMGQDQRDDVLRNRNRYIMIMGCDWNDDKIGTRIIALALDKVNRKFFVAERRTVSKDGWTQVEAVNAIIEMNRKYVFEHIYVDEGFGVSQIQFMKKYAVDRYGVLAEDHPDLKLAEVVGVNFSSKVEIVDQNGGESTKKDTKVYMVENAVTLLEKELFILDEVYDSDLVAQMHNYIIKSRSPTGRPTFAAEEAKIGDHDLDAFMIALFGFAMEYSEFLNIDHATDLIHIVSRSVMSGDGVDTSGYEYDLHDPSLDASGSSEDLFAGISVYSGRRRGSGLSKRSNSGYNRSNFTGRGSEGMTNVKFKKYRESLQQVGDDGYISKDASRATGMRNKGPTKRASFE